MTDKHHNARAPRILICEAELLSAEDMAGTLKDLGYDIAGIAVRGEEAVRMAREVRPDLILIDIRLAGKVDGIEAAEQIRAELDIPVVYLTAYTEKDRLERAKLSQPYGYLEKPAGLLELRSTIETASYRHEADRKAREGEARRARAEELAGFHSWEWDIRTGRLARSAQSYHAFGLDPEEAELTVDTFINSVHPDDRESVGSALADALGGKRPYDLEFRIVRPNGQQRVLHSRGEVQRDSTGQPIRMRGMALDVTDRKKAEEALRESEEKYRLLFSKEKDAIVLTDAQTLAFLDVNEAAERLWGYTKDELLNMTALDVSSEPGESRRSLAAGARPEGVEVPVRWHKKTDGTIFPVEITAGSFDLNGRKVVCSIVRDITDRLASDQALRDSQFFLQSTLDALSAHIAILDENGIIVAVNGPWRRFANDNDACLLQHGIGLNYLEICDTAKGDRSEDAPMIAAMIRSLIVGEKEELHWEYPCHSPSEKRWFVLHATRFVMNGRVRVVLAHETITERKMTEEALRQSEERFRAIFEGATDYIWIKDRSLSFTHVNPAMCKLVGLPASEVIGRQSRDIYGEDIGRQLDALDARALKGETIDLEQARSVHGAVMRFHDTLAPLRSQASDIIGICGISRNITERQRARAQSPRSDHDYLSPAMRATLKKARVAAASDGIILLQGESGGGKDFLARWIHDHSKRSNGPFFSISCAAVSKELAESELFGHERGAFTGALGTKRGLLQLAEGGTILLNEIGELSLSVQAKLLTFLDTRSFVRVGGERHISVDARLIAATHRELRKEVEEKRFLEPLFHRLNVFPIRVPPLRERTEDLPVLVDEIISVLAPELQLTVLPIIEPSVIDILSRYEWPGNVRELRNVLERSLMLCRGGPLTLDMPGALGSDKQVPCSERADKHWSYLVRYSPEKGLDGVVEEVEASLSQHVLRITQDNKNEAAKLLKISRGALYRLLKKWEGKRMD